MNVLRLIFNTLFELLKVITYKWAVAIFNIIKRLIYLIKQFLKYLKLPHDVKNAVSTDCSTIDHPSYHRADPLIYSQKYLLGKGLAVTWNNPDITLLRNGVIVEEDKLLPNTTYEIDATIWNNSYDAPVAGMAVNFSYLSFGASTTLTPIGTTAVDIGVKGTANHPAHTRIKWTTPPAGHYCIQVDFNWPDDVNHDNNIGQNNIDVKEAHSPAVFHFDLKNGERKPEDFYFETDCYTLPQPIKCAKQIDENKTREQKWEEIKRRHSREAYAVPAGWTVIINPSTVSLLPGEVRSIEVAIEPPPAFIGRKSFNINSFGRRGRPAGGVTLTVTKV